MFRELSTEQLKTLIDTGELLLSNGKGTAYVIIIPLNTKVVEAIEKQDIKIIKVPFSGYDSRPLSIWL